ncbi:hypothetical protein [Prescottella agglutinans]|uniref:hypothetical protein n=1 Tax=Prescottella agglutinans TaxID=1644129 RepID=UPI003145504F
MISSAAITVTVTIAYGSSRTSDGRNDSRYACSAGMVWAGEKCRADANGSPRMPAQRVHGHLVGARGVADAQVDPVRVQRVEGAELFGRGARDAWHRVVLGEPEAVVAEPFA